MTTATEMFAFWLIPALQEHRWFSSLIGEFAERFDAPVFEPHVTLHGRVIGRERALRALCEVPAAMNYELEIEGIFSSATYTKTLFVRFRLSDGLCQLREEIAQALDLQCDDVFDPHLSLLYKEMPTCENEALARGIKIPFQRVRFEGLKLIAHPPIIATREDVEAWREIGQRSLTTSPA